MIFGRKKYKELEMQLNNLEIYVLELECPQLFKIGDEVKVAGKRNRGVVTGTQLHIGLRERYYHVIIENTIIEFNANLITPI